MGCIWTGGEEGREEVAGHELTTLVIGSIVYCICISVDKDALTMHVILLFKSRRDMTDTTN